MKAAKIPLIVYVLALTIFSLTTSEFMVAGMMNSLAQVFAVSLKKIGLLISLYATGMVVGGPLLTYWIIRQRIANKRALLFLLFGYAIAQTVATVASSYMLLAAARLITGVLGSACFGVALAICFEVTSERLQVRAVSIVVGGLMLATVVGVPLAGIIDQSIGWRASFALVVVLSLVSMMLISLLLKSQKAVIVTDLSEELASFKNPHLWAAYASSALIIGATFAAFSYFNPIFIGLTGFSEATVPWLLAVYGVCNVLGNHIVGRYADRYTFGIMTGGLLAMVVSLLLFIVFADQAWLVLVLVMVIGLVGVPMNPAMIARVMHTVNPGALVNTVHTSIINIGLGVGAWAGGLGIEGTLGLRAPLWVGVLLAILGLLSLLPYLWGKRNTSKSTTCLA